jgi:hypothetical protein
MRYDIVITTVAGEPKDGKIVPKISRVLSWLHYLYIPLIYIFHKSIYFLKL